MAPSQQINTSDIMRLVCKRGRYTVCYGLLLQVRTAGRASWVWRYSCGGVRKEMGLGSFPSVTFAMAKKMTIHGAKALAAGRDPLEERRAGRLPFQH